MKAVNAKYPDTYRLGATPFGRTLEVRKIYKTLYPNDSLATQVLIIQSIIWVFVVSLMLFLGIVSSLHYAS